MHFVLNTLCATHFLCQKKTLCYFATYLGQEGLAAQTIKTYLATAHNLHISLGFPDLRDRSSLPLLRRIQNVQMAKNKPSKRIRMPIMPVILDQLKQHWDETEHQHKILLWAVASLCFAGFFCLGELLPASADTAAVSQCIRWGDITVDNASAPSTICVHLRVSKCDQLGKGVDVFVGKLPLRRCPAVATVAYMLVRGLSTDPFFIKADKPLTKPVFIAELRAAIAASQAGLVDSTIQLLGHWNSAAFLTYICTPRQQLASLTLSFM